MSLFSCSQVALLLFSKWDDPKSPYYLKEDDKTKLVISFKLHYTAEEFGRFINNTDYNSVKGGHTRTDKALEILYSASLGNIQDLSLKAWIQILPQG